MTNALKFDSNLLQSPGLVAELGPKRLQALVTILALQNENNGVSTNYEDVAKGMGVSTESAKRWVRKLTRVKWNGQPLCAAKRGVIKAINPFDRG
ncbi:hypothetical protein B7C51_06935 [Paenibacillus larvae subsp. pulvifaciens]|uniref:Helix-turn-helix domain-containing protein n=1 Tax=Paenibacillus larvae subsp. pulvifaciens TaxID=1477 RepID=A0A1V0UQR4_9BACL|nr:hypothetical protein [Paenibacillus larvae]ARF67623.1 hypothetical protein B7C51_06935 [Paenibacillus larvae subsp. pulvifaciens]